MKPLWKEASSLILTAFKGAAVRSGYDYTLLSLRRSAKSSFMPKGYVFPGGNIDVADTKMEWLTLFPDFIKKFHNVSLIKAIPPILQGQEEMPKLLSLKVTAIRETFEETGILLCCNKSDIKKEPNDWVTCSTFPELNDWRLKVQKNAYEFYNLCQHYKCCPDVQNIHLWSNWLTPTSTGSKRFDAIFFLACMRNIPNAAADNCEIENLSWISPDELMKQFKNNKIFLPPPQVYETSRMLQFDEIHCLNHFATARSKEGCERWMPVQFKTLDGTVSLLPGDDEYKPTNFCTPLEPIKVDMTMEQFRTRVSIHHRMETMEKSGTKIILNRYLPTNGHVLPVEEK